MGLSPVQSDNNDGKPPITTPYVDITNYSGNDWYTTEKDGYLNYGLSNVGTGIVAINIDTSSVNVSIKDEPNTSSLIFIKKGTKLQKRYTYNATGGFAQFWPLT